MVISLVNALVLAGLANFRVAIRKLGTKTVAKFPVPRLNEAGPKALPARISNHMQDGF